MRNWFRPWIHGKPHGMTNKTTNRIDTNKEKSNCKCSNGYILKIPPFHVVVIFVFLMDAQDPMIKSLMKSQNYLIIFSLPPPFIILKIVINLLQNVCLGILQQRNGIGLNRFDIDIQRCI